MAHSIYKYTVIKYSDILQQAFNEHVNKWAYIQGD